MRKRFPLSALLLLACALSLLSVLPARAAFPTVAATAASTDNASDTTQTVSLPGSISSGDLLIICMVLDAVTTTTVPTGWTRLFGDTDLPASAGTVAAFYRQADGTEGGSVDVTTAGNARAGAVAYRITGHEDPATQAPEASTGASANSTSPDPDSLTPTGGSKDYLWLIAAGWNGNPTPTGSPASYSNEITASPFGNVAIRGMERQLTASSEDPGNWTLSSPKKWVAWTVAVHPSGGAPARRLMVISANHPSEHPVAVQPSCPYGYERLHRERLHPERAGGRK